MQQGERRNSGDPPPELNWAERCDQWLLNGWTLGRWFIVVVCAVVAVVTLVSVRGGACLLVVAIPVCVCVLIGVVMMRRSHRRRIAELERCPRCLYVVRGLEHAGVCPECGGVIVPAPVAPEVFVEPSGAKWADTRVSATPDVGIRPSWVFAVMCITTGAMGLIMCFAGQAAWMWYVVSGVVVIAGLRALYQYVRASRAGRG